MSIFRDGILTGKVALVTGGGSGIGAGIARVLAHQGAAVTLVGRTPEKLEAAAAQIRGAVPGARVLAAPADVREFARLDEAVGKTVAEFGGLDIAISSAAGNFLAPAAQLSTNGFRTVVDIDLCGTFNTCRAAFPHLAKRRGSIVSITATQAFVPMPLQCHAGAAKAGIEKLTRDLALEWASSGVRVNTVAPGPIDDTEGMKRLAPGDFAEKSKKHVPLGRWGTIDEIAEAVLYLVSPAAAFVTGCSLLIDGGSSLVGAGGFLELMNG
jgi:NAD(P)-dependent dehydrogenase (short-subunit alcohol dehydrogenase family)